MITDRPDSAYETCTKYAPNCVNPQRVAAKPKESSSKTSKSTSSSKKEKSSKSRTKITKQRASSDQAAGSSYRGFDSLSASRNDRNFVERTSLRNFAASAFTESSISHDSDIDSDGLGIGLGGNGEDDYYDSLNSGDDIELTNSRPNRTRPLSPEPVYNPEPGIHDIEPLNREPGIYYPDFDQSPNIPEVEAPETSNSTSFSTIVNGVKIKTLPGPRGIATCSFVLFNIHS